MNLAGELANFALGERREISGRVVERCSLFGFRFRSGGLVMDDLEMDEALAGEDDDGRVAGQERSTIREGETRAPGCDSGAGDEDGPDAAGSAVHVRASEGPAPGAAPGPLSPRDTGGAPEPEGDYQGVGRGDGDPSGLPMPGVLSGAHGVNDTGIGWHVAATGEARHIVVNETVRRENGPGRRVWEREAGQPVCRPRGFRRLVATTEEPDCKACLEAVVEKKLVLKEWPTCVL